MMIEPRIIQRVGSLARIQLNQARLTIAGRIWLAEECNYHAQCIAMDIDDGHAEDGAKADLVCCIHERKVRSGLINVFNQHAAIWREKRRRQLAKQLDLLRSETSMRGHVQRFA